jgi:hypothetical protein
MCKEERPLDNFTMKTKTRRQSQCRECQKVYRRKHYLKNKTKYLAKANKWRKSSRAKLAKLKTNQPCADCKKIYPPYVMDYHHRNNTKKEICIGHQVANIGWGRILEEIKKCDLICANCHRIRTHKKSE